MHYSVLLSTTEYNWHACTLLSYSNGTGHDGCGVDGHPSQESNGEANLQLDPGMRCLLSGLTVFRMGSLMTASQVRVVILYRNLLQPQEQEQHSL